MPLEHGDRLGVYEVVSAIGAGGMGEGYKARDTKLDRDVALKILLSSGLSSTFFVSTTVGSTRAHLQ